LYLSGNEAIGDSGAAAIAAALKTSPRISLSQPVIHTLDLSSCGIGDTGVEALATAIEANPGCVLVLDLSNNRITDEGAVMLARALQQSYEMIRSRTTGSESILLVRGIMEHLDLSNNKHIGSKGLSELSLSMECDALRRLSLRSCSVQADGVANVGKMFSSLASKKSSNLDSITSRSIPIQVDLSGNAFGSLQEKGESGIASYSASLLKSKASATTASYLNFIGKKIKSGLKDAGLDIEGLLPPQDQSDDEDGDGRLKKDDDTFDDSTESNEVDYEYDAIDIASKYSAPQCGARAFADAIFEDNNNWDESASITVHKSSAYCLQVGMRFCSLDSSSVDGLAAVKLLLRDRYHVDLRVDVSMNKNIESNLISALRSESPSFDESNLNEMSQRYTEARETIRKARERAKQATEAEAARLQAEDAISGIIGDEEDKEEDLYDDY